MRPIAPLLLLGVAALGAGGTSPRVTLAASTEATVVRIVQPFAVAVSGPDVYVADAANGRIVRLGRRGAVVHASRLDEPTGLAAAPGGEPYAADFAAGVVRRIGRDGRLSVLARLPQVTSVAISGAHVYAVWR